jgi:protein-L-isoaspartate(D-aspartate) O-methyltransferase
MPERNRFKAGLDNAFAPLRNWAMGKIPARVNERSAMVSTQIAARGIKNPDVLAAMRAIPRHEFVPPTLRDHAYEDGALPIGNGQTISQPYIVALMTEALGLTKDCRVLEIGTGCGYQSAVLAALCQKVYSLEIIAELADETRQRLARLGIDNVEIRTADGYRGWPEEAPFDCIMVTAAPDHIPEHLIAQLKEGGRLIIPVGEGNQDLIVFTLTREGLQSKRLIPVRFVPMTGEAMNPARRRWGNQHADGY